MNSAFLRILFLTLFMSTAAHAGSDFVNPFYGNSLLVRCTVPDGSNADINIYWTRGGIGLGTGTLSDKLATEGINVEADWNTQELYIENLKSGVTEKITVAQMEGLFDIKAENFTYPCTVISEDSNP